MGQELTEGSKCGLDVFRALWFSSEHTLGSEAQGRRWIIRLESRGVGGASMLTPADDMVQ